MNWNRMNKQEKQKLSLIVLLVAIVLGALYQFVLVPQMNRHDSAIQRRDELQANVDRAQMMFRSGLLMDKQTKALRSDLERIFSTQMPSPDSALSWAQQAVFARTRPMGLDVISISGMDSSMAGWDQADMAKRFFKPYTVKVDLACSFEQAKELVRSLHQSNPYLAVTSVMISSATSKENVEKLTVSLLLEWPSWRDVKRGQHPFDGGAGATDSKEPKTSA